METIFKEGDKVFHIEYGRGVVIRSVIDENYPVEVDFDDGSHILFTKTGKETKSSLQPMLSFTEYRLEGFSQERPEELPEVGEEVMVSDDFGEWYICNFVDYLKGEDHPYLVKSRNTRDYAFKYLKRLK